MIGFYAGMGFIALVIVVVCALWLIWAIDQGRMGHSFMSVIVGIVLVVAVVLSFNWYKDNTAGGQRMVKSWESEVKNGLPRQIFQWGLDGDAPALMYEGRFDITDDAGDSILFEDDKGLRHVIYKGINTITIDEIPEEQLAG